MSPPSPPPRQGLLLLVLGALTAFGALSIDMYLPSLPTLQRELATSASAVQLTLAAFMGGLGVAQLAYGPLSDRFGRRRPLLVGIVLYVLAAAACAFAPSIEWLIALRFFQAMGAAAGPVIARAVVRDHYNGREAARVLSLLMLVMGAAPILAPLAGGWVLELASWRAIFGVLAVLGIACLVASSAILPRTAPSQGQVAPPPGTLGRNVRLLLSDRRFVAASLVGAFAQAGLFSYISGSPFVLMGLHHVSPKAFAWIFGMNAMGLIGASQFNRWLLRRYPPARIALTAALGASLLGAALVVLSVTGAGGASALVPTLFLFLASTGLMLPNATALAMEEHGARAGIASALLGSAQYAIAAGASFLVGLLNDGSPRSMAVMMGLSAVGAWVAGGVTTGAVAAREPPEGAPATR